MKKTNVANLKDIRVSDFTDKAAYNYFVKYAKKFKTTEKLTSIQRVKKLKKMRRRVLFVSAIYGALGVITLYIPQYLFPQIFHLQSITLPYINYTFNVSITEMVYGLFLVALEIWLLTMTDLRSVGRIAALYGFPPTNAFNQFDEDAAELVYISMGKDRKKLQEIGINPLQNTSKAGIFLLLILFRVKAVLSKFVFKFILKRTLGRLAMRAVLDMAGIPIYAFWNAYASSVIIRKASMRLRAHELMNDTGNWFHKRFKNNQEFKALLYDCFEYIAIVKKSFHPTDYLFAKYFLNLFEIKPEKEHVMTDNFLDKVKKSAPNIKYAISKLLIIGFLMDGKLGRLEINELKKLEIKELMPFGIPQIKKWSNEYRKGHNFEKLLNKK